MSQGEEIIRLYLNWNGIDFVEEFEFSKYKYRLDFLCKFSGHFVAIEFHGAQHYSEVFAGHSLEKQRNRDNFMREFCAENNIHLIELDSRTFELITSQYSARNHRSNKFVFEKLREAIHAQLIKNFESIELEINRKLTTTDFKTQYISNYEPEDSELAFFDLLISDNIVSKEADHLSVIFEEVKNLRIFKGYQYR